MPLLRNSPSLFDSRGNKASGDIKGKDYALRSVLVTGGAGFIGSHLVDRLMSDGWRTTVVDNFDPFYDMKIKRRNVNAHLKDRNFKLVELDIRDLKALRTNLSGDYDVIVHLAARAEVNTEPASCRGGLHEKRKMWSGIWEANAA